MQLNIKVLESWSELNTYTARFLFTGFYKAKYLPDVWRLPWPIGARLDSCGRSRVRPRYEFIWISLGLLKTRMFHLQRLPAFFVENAITAHPRYLHSH